MLIPIGEVFKIPARVLWHEALTDELKLREYIFQNTNMEICYPDWGFPRMNPYREIWAPMPSTKEIVAQYKKDKARLKQGVPISELDDPFYDEACNSIGEYQFSLHEELIYDLKQILYRKQKIQKMVDSVSARLASCENSLATKKHNKQYKAELEADVSLYRAMLDNPPPIKLRKEIRWRELLTNPDKWDEYLYQHAEELSSSDDYSHPWHYWERPFLYGEFGSFCGKPSEYLMKKYAEAKELLAAGVPLEDIDDPIYGIMESRQEKTSDSDACRITFEQMYYDPTLAQAYYQQIYQKYKDYIYSISEVDPVSGVIIYTSWPMSGRKFFPNQYVFNAAFKKWVETNIANGFLPGREELEKMDVEERKNRCLIASSRVPDDEPEWYEFVAYIDDENRFYQDVRPNELLTPPPGLFVKIFFGEAQLSEYYDHVNATYDKYLQDIDEKYQSKGLIPRFIWGKPDEEDIKKHYHEWKSTGTGKGLLPTKKQLAKMTPEEIEEVKKKVSCNGSDFI